MVGRWTHTDQEDDLLETLARGLKTTDTILDVGAGAGRFSLPLALRCKHVTAVEPSPSMAAAFEQQASRYCIANVTLVKGRWEDVEVEPADRAISVHVPYFVADISRFIRKLNDLTRQQVMVLMNRVPPQAHTAMLWQRIHGEKQILQPGADHMVRVLRELGVSPHIEPLPSQGPRTFSSLDAAVDYLSLRLFLVSNSPKHRLLREAVGEMFVGQEGSFQLTGAIKSEPILI